MFIKNKSVYLTPKIDIQKDQCNQRKPKKQGKKKKEIEKFGKKFITQGKNYRDPVFYRKATFRKISQVQENMATRR